MNFKTISNSVVLKSLVALAAFGVGVALAQGAPAKASKGGGDPVEIKLERKKVTSVDGKEVLAPAETAKPGDFLLETATYTNKSSAPVRKLEATLPIPANTVFVAGSAAPAGVKASTDGKAFASVPLVRKVTSANGVVTERPVPLSEYKFLRWSVEALAPGQSTVVSAKFQVSTN